MINWMNVHTESTADRTPLTTELWECRRIQIRSANYGAAHSEAHQSECMTSSSHDRCAQNCHGQKKTSIHCKHRWFRASWFSMNSFTRGRHWEASKKPSSGFTFRKCGPVAMRRCHGVGGAPTWHRNGLVTENATVPKYVCYSDGSQTIFLLPTDGQVLQARHEFFHRFFLSNNLDLITFWWCLECSSRHFQWIAFIHVLRWHDLAIFASSPLKLSSL